MQDKTEFHFQQTQITMDSGIKMVTEQIMKELSLW